ncbi:MAG TPA: DEAD/DEAH box helicase [Candidatus Limiplasma sp.]|nr:DEAD/DEAH box helicase [Candidatus Limiplasma sp.]
MKHLQNLPPYLRIDGAQADVGQTYGTLTYNRRSQCWVIKADPNVTELCKRLFPGTVSRRRGEARFTAHRRIIADLNWLMMRYPLVIAPRDQKRWEDALEKARTYVLERQEALRTPARIKPDPSVFRGKLTAFQEEGLAFLLRTDRCLLADEMGLGKTVQSLALLSHITAYPAMIIAPAHLLRNWENEINRFIQNKDSQPLRVHIIKGLKPYTLPPADIYLMHYLLLRGWKQYLSDTGFETVIFDEIQELRHSGTEKYSAASLLADHAKRVIGLSGTPIYNRGAEIWNVINILDFQFLGNYESFTREWCYGYGNQIVAKPELLGDYLRREGIMIRRTKQDVLYDLPPKRRLVMTIESNQSIYHKLMQPLHEKIDQLRHGEDLTGSQRSVLKMEIEQGERQATGIAKAPFVAQFVRALLEGGEKVLLFAHHHQVMDLYKKDLHTFSPCFVTGRETQKQKETSLERFTNGRSNLCCISLRSASGLNLQQATCVVFGELDWSPAVHSQAEDRAHRMGQKDSILCYYLVSQGGSDQDMQDALGLKVSQFTALMGDQVKSQDQILAESQYAQRYIEQLIQRLLENRESSE